MNCNHIIGKAIQEYQESIVHADDSPDDFHFNSFSGFKFCPHCGKDVSELASVFDQKMDERYEKFWQDQRERFGEDRYQADRYQRGPVWEEREKLRIENEAKRRKKWEEEDKKRFQGPPRFTSFLEKTVTPEGEGYQWPSKIPPTKP